MTQPTSGAWYEGFFGEDYWKLAEIEYTETRTAAEAEYVKATLREMAPGSRVVDLGCGLGRHAIRLGEAGFDVTGIDLSTWALRKAEARASEVGVRVQWKQFDLLSTAQWPIELLDAAICIQSFGWGSDADQLRFLQHVRQHLVPGGILILDHSSLLWIVRNFMGRAEAKVDGATYKWDRGYDPVTGVSYGSIRVSSEGRDTRELQHEIRLYAPADIVSLVRRAGFGVERVDGDFRRGTPVTMDTRYVQIVARALPTPPKALAVARYALPGMGVDDALDLRWSPDEHEWLRPSPEQIWDGLLKTDAGHGADLARRYAVDDPYGACRATAVLSEQFGCPLSSDQITFGAGVSALLQQICHLAESGVVLGSRFGHPDVLAWAATRGAVLRLVDEVSPASDLTEEIARQRPCLIYLERPTLFGELLRPEELEVVARAASRIGAVVVLDEAYASYLGPAASCISLISQFANIVIFRSLSKGYAWGGLRVGFAVASPGIAARVRECVTPMQCSELAYSMALQLLRAGDIFKTLRDRIAAVKPEVVAQLKALGLQVINEDPALPWVAMPDIEGSASKTLTSRKLVGKVIRPHLPRRDEPQCYVRLSIPLSEARLTAFARLVGRHEALSGAEIQAWSDYATL